MTSNCHTTGVTASKIRGKEGFPSTVGHTMIDIENVTLECLGEGEKRKALMRSHSTASVRDNIFINDSQMHEEMKAGPSDDDCRVDLLISN